MSPEFESTFISVVAVVGVVFIFATWGMFLYAWWRKIDTVSADDDEELEAPGHANVEDQIGSDLLKETLAFRRAKLGGSPMPLRDQQYYINVQRVLDKTKKEDK